MVERGCAIVSGGTDNHLMLVDLRPKGVKGNAAEQALGRAGITCNKNGVPFDPEKPTVTSGVRLGTPAGTTRGFGVRRVPGSRPHDQRRARRLLASPATTAAVEADGRGGRGRRCARGSRSTADRERARGAVRLLAHRIQQA